MPQSFKRFQTTILRPLSITTNAIIAQATVTWKVFNTCSFEDKELCMGFFPFIKVLQVSFLKG